MRSHLVRLVHSLPARSRSPRRAPRRHFRFCRIRPRCAPPPQARQPRFIIPGIAIAVMATMPSPILTLGGTTSILIFILIIIIRIDIPIIILIPTIGTGAGAGVRNYGVTIAVAIVRFDRAKASRHGFGACGAAVAARSRIALSFAISASESPRAPAQSGLRKSAASFGISGLSSPKGELPGLFNR